MAVFNSGLDIFHTDGSRIIWSTSRRPALLLPGESVTISPFTVQFPDFQKSNAYGFAYTDDPILRTSCLSLTTINPQEWDSGLSPLATVPSGCNYFEAQVTLSRTKTPSTFINFPFPDNWSSGSSHFLDGGALMESIGPIVRIFTLEQVGNQIFLRRKQSVENAGPQFPWNSGNNNSTGSGGFRNGWTYGGNQNAWAAREIETKAGGNVNKRRGEANACSLNDTSDYESIWTGSITITPGYIDVT